jgi:glutathione-specific gamma-glutamylcyclotransferase
LSLWIFGYGSLLFRPDFPFARSAVGTVADHARRFHQGSPDHRGTPERLGRVVTLVGAPGESTTGVAYEVRADDAESVLVKLDLREQGGYERVEVDVALADAAVRATTWIAPPANPYWLGDAPLAAIAAHVREARGPSGTNLDYVLALAAKLADLGIDDPHVTALAALARRA